MARLGKTLREEEKGGGTGSNFFHLLYRPLEIYGDTPAERLRQLIVYVLLGLSLILLITTHWIIAGILFAVVIVLGVLRAPRGPFYKDSDH
jgi:predicted membrane channel-forming protein YqfA (hemolysin III family)